ncbi:serine/threonine dehydratase [Rhodococcus sp. SJ-2]
MDRVPVSSDHDNPQATAPATAVDHESVVDAARRITSIVRRTPIVTAAVPTPNGPVEVVFKLEYLQHGGSFKVRGSLNAFGRARENGTLPAAGVLIASGGNAAIGAAWAARYWGTPCTVVVPDAVPPAKLDRLRRLGATVHRAGWSYADAAAHAATLAGELGAVTLHAYDLPDIVAGAGTIALELAEQIGSPMECLVAVGGGGLVAGVTAGARDTDVIHGVEPAGAAALHRALAAGGPIDIEVDSIAADSLGATRIGNLAWAAASSGRIDSLVVDDAAIVDARRWLWDELRIVVEHGTAAALAPVLAGTVTPAAGRTLCVVLCGANTAVADLG